MPELLDLEPVENLLSDDEVEEVEQVEEEEVEEIKIVGDQLDCNVCLGPMKNGPLDKRWTNLNPCHHKIHVICALTWFATKGRKVCPMCATSVTLKI